MITSRLRFCTPTISTRRTRKNSIRRNTFEAKSQLPTTSRSA
jgi:hypothetical protein